MLTPGEDGIAKMQGLYRKQFEMEITQEEAGNVLSRLMQFIYLTSGDGTEPEPAGIYPEPE
jgi:hypothetical protein